MQVDDKGLHRSCGIQLARSTRSSVVASVRSWGVARTLRSAPVAALLGAALMVAPALRAQVIVGRVTSSGSGSVAGAIVQLLDSTGAPVARALADTDGHFSLRAPAAGRYRLEVLRIGFRPDTEALRLVRADSAAHIQIFAPDEPVTLPLVRVTARSDCQMGPNEGRDALTLWTEASKALVTTQLTSEQRRLHVRLAMFEQELDSTTNRVRSQRIRIVQGPARVPFYTLSAAVLRRKGYAEADSTGVIFHAPDASVLLSQDFGVGHCWGVTASNDSERVGLAFRPARGTSGIVDVAGTLWLDRRTGWLRSLDFHYTNVDSAFTAAGGGGHLAFTRLPGGAWIISRWFLRLPTLAPVRSSQGRLVGGIMTGMSFEAGTAISRQVKDVLVTGGVVLEAVGAAGTKWSADLGALEGTVVDSASKLPIANVSVALLGTDYRTTTDSTGRFRIGNALPGQYQLILSDPMLDTMGLTAVHGPEVTVPEAGTVAVQLALPDSNMALAQVCGPRPDVPLADALVLRGTAFNTNGSPVAPGRRVVISWSDGIDAASGFGSSLISERHAVIATDASGQFRLCGAFRGRRLLFDVQADDGHLTPVDSLIVPTDRPFIFVNLRLRKAGTSSLSGFASIFGTLVDSGGRPVADAHVNVVGTPLSAITDSTGVFRLSGIPPGHHVLAFRRIGIPPADGTMDAHAGEVIRTTYRWHPAVFELAPMVVREEQRDLSSGLAGFDARRRAGRGQFAERKEFELYAPRDVSDVLRRMHSLTIKDMDGARVAVSERGLKVVNGHPRDCVMPVVVDGLLMPQPFSLEDVPIADVAAVEVYAGPSEIPAEFNGTRQDTDCGLVLIWTRHQ